LHDTKIVSAILTVEKMLRIIPLARDFSEVLKLIGKNFFQISARAAFLMFPFVL
jgi:hypothetical protein